LGDILAYTFQEVIHVNDKVILFPSLALDASEQEIPVDRCYILKQFLSSSEFSRSASHLIQKFPDIQCKT